MEWLAGDGSDRCYFRLSSPELKESFVLMQLSGSDAEALRQNGYDWITVGETLTAAGIRIPKLHRSLPDFAALIIEDYGDVTFETLIHRLLKQDDEAGIDHLYDKCFQAIVSMLKINAHPPSVWNARAFDTEKYSWELHFFRDKYIKPIIAKKFGKREEQLFAQEASLLAKYLGGFSNYFVHRDFHSRNIMGDDCSLAIIDFQDSRLGPISYDFASLVFDNYVPLSLSKRLDLVKRSRSVIAGQIGANEAQAFDEQIKAVTLQRQLKAIGTYGFLTLDKKRGNYLKYVRPALATLTSETVYDERWPFLSGDLIKQLNERPPDES